MTADDVPDVNLRGAFRTLRENERLRRSVLDRTPQTRFADPTETPGSVVVLASTAAGFVLASTAAGFVTGETLAADGGWTAR